MSAYYYNQFIIFENKLLPFRILKQCKIYDFTTILQLKGTE